MARPNETVVLGATHPGTALRLLRSNAGWYLGYLDKDGQPYSRETMYFNSEAEARLILSYFRTTNYDAT